MTARALSWGYVYDCGCLVFQVATTVTVKPCHPACPNRAEAMALIEARREVERNVRVRP